MQDKKIEIIVKYLKENKDKFSQYILINKLEESGYNTEDILIGVKKVYESEVIPEAPAKEEVPPEAPVKSEEGDISASKPVSSVNQSSEAVIKNVSSPPVEGTTSSVGKSAPSANKSNVLNSSTLNFNWLEDFFIKVGKGFKENFSDSIERAMEHKLLTIALLLKVGLFFVGCFKIMAFMGLFLVNLMGVSVLPFSVVYFAPLLGVLFFCRWSYGLAIAISSYSLFASVAGLIASATTPVVISINSGNPVITAVVIIINMILDAVIIYSAIMIMIHKDKSER